ncbi:hypothetical protein IEN85_00570 [Pelagicoccus sp. NFK12]|uniref:Uncharacterized protein n=1 Tax=Pelagicoccus enzymogenes TaxID=2773457 RepID=A0A927F5E4_9BACT|nr:hypothetical protein [Pelagicoccus enzymogenes]MBD5777986.1 hypothetical protein [Pelagicoccus enzymogenes]MDQ8197956.1 hypothetical protein [Pelagicoccus enzymogenes]
MKALGFRLAGIGAMVLGFVFWMYGGARLGWYAEFYVVEKVDPIMELTYTEEVPAFLPGVEALALGFLAFVALMAIGALIDRKGASLGA